jgi:hypothetical protein
MDSLDKVQIGSSWVNINAETSISSGAEIAIQNIGANVGASQKIGTPDAVIEVTTNSSEPSSSFTGWHITQGEVWIVSSGSPSVWCKFSSLGDVDVGGHLCNIKVQEL